MGLALSDRRAFLGGVSLLISGTIITVMLLQYLAVLDSAGFTRSRLWWEIALNLQIFAGGLMWFCYTDRIEDSTGRVRSLNRLRLALGMYGVLLPALIALVGVANEWFQEKPDSIFLVVFAVAMYSVWQLGVIVDWFVRRNIYAEKRHNSIAQSDPSSAINRIVLYLPIIALVVITIFCWVNDDAWWVLAIPVFVYIQGSMPFFMRAFGKQI